MNFLRKRHRRLCGLFLVLLQLSFAQEVSFRITPLRPVEELRAQALKEQPPHEQGTFLKPDLAELVKLDLTIKLDIRYATTNNFLGTPVYTQARAFLQRPAAEALLRAHHELQAQGYGLIIHDGYRPWYVTKIFWDATPDDKKIFVANPAEGSKHNRGCAHCRNCRNHDSAVAALLQQSYVIDKRITSRFMHYERADLAIGIVFVIGAIALIAIAAATFAGDPEFGHFTDAGAVAAALDRHVGRIACTFFALALIDSCVIGAMAVSLSTDYAIGDVLSLRHSLHSKPADAKAFYAVYGGLVALAAGLVLAPGTPLGLLTNAVQALAGVLLPSATVFLLLLCNNRAVLGPWVNRRWLNLFTGAVIALLVVLSVILTASVLFPGISEGAILMLLGAGAALAIIAGLVLGTGRAEPVNRKARLSWHMPRLADLPPAPMAPLVRMFMLGLRAYLVLVGGLVLARIVMLATGHA